MFQIFSAILAALTARKRCPRCGHLQNHPTKDRSNKITCDRCGHLFLKKTLPSSKFVRK